MADKKISQLTGATTPLAGSEVLPIVQGGSTVKVSVDNLTAGKSVSATTFQSTATTGTAPLTVASTTEVANLRAANATSADTSNAVKSNATTGVLQVVGPAAAATRVMTVPDANFTAARTDAAQTFTGTQTFTTVNSTTFDTNVAAAKVTLSGTTLAADGSDTNVDVNITPKGTGEVSADGLVRTFGLKGRTYQTGDTAYGPGGNQATGSGFLARGIQVGDIIDFPFGQTRTVTGITDTVITVNSNFTVSFSGVSNTGYSCTSFTTNAGLMLSLTPGGFCRAGIDDTYDWGSSDFRWDDIYATNATIQTSDENEKQDIRDLLEAEKRVGVALKGLMKAYRWKSAVAKKGDDARIHFGAIAQHVKAAFEAEGLDASRYGMFIESVWWENANGDHLNSNIGLGGVEDTTLVKKSRLGLRYNELFAFIIASM